MISKRRHQIRWISQVQLLLLCFCAIGAPRPYLHDHTWTGALDMHRSQEGIPTGTGMDRDVWTDSRIDPFEEGMHWHWVLGVGFAKGQRPVATGETSYRAPAESFESESKLNVPTGLVSSHCEAARDEWLSRSSLTGLYRNPMEAFSPPISRLSRLRI